MVNAVALGLVSGTDCFFPKIAASSNKKHLGVMTQRAAILMLVSSLACVMFFLNIEHVLLALGQDPLVVRLASRYLFVFIPAIPCVFLMFTLEAFLLCQGIMKPSVVLSVTAFILNGLIQYIFVFILDYRLFGSALATMVTFVTWCVLYFVYTICSGVYKDTWTGFTWDCLRHRRHLYLTCLFSMSMVLVKWGSLEMSVILSGLLGRVEIGAMAIAYQLQGLIYMPASGMRISTGILIGRALGANKPSKAKGVTYLACTMSICSMAVISGVVIVLREYIPVMFTNITDVQSLTSKLILFMGIMTPIQCWSAMSSTGVRTTGRTQLSTASVLVSYLIGTFTGITLMFNANLGTKGFIIGLTISYFLDSCFESFLVLQTDWDKQCHSMELSSGDLSTSNGRKLSSVMADEKMVDDYLSYRRRMNHTIAKTVFLFVAILTVLVTGFLFFFLIPHYDVFGLCLPRNITSTILIDNFYNLDIC